MPRYHRKISPERTMHTMAKKLNQHVMTAKFREGLIAAYENALAKLDIYPGQTLPHIIGTATVTITNSDLETLRTHYGKDLIEITPHRNSGSIEISLPEGFEYLKANRPTMTKEEREAKAAGKGTMNREEAERRKADREALRKRLAELHQIDLDAELEDETETDE